MNLTTREGGREGGIRGKEVEYQTKRTLNLNSNQSQLVADVKP